MAKKTDDECCVIKLPLLLEKWQEDRLAKRLEIARQLYNTLLNAELKKLRKLEHSVEYREVQRQYKENNNRSDVEKKKLSKQRDDLLHQNGLCEYGFKKDMGRYYKHFGQNIGSSVAVHGIAAQVWAAFKKLLYGNGKKVHFKRVGELNSVRGYSVSKKSGGTEIMFRGEYIEWKGLSLKLKLDKNNSYEKEMLEKWVKFVRIVREPGKNKSRWYAQLTLKGTPVVKRNEETGQPMHFVGEGKVGIDIGPQTIAYVASNEVALVELADKVQSIEKQKCLIQRKMDRSRRANNPNNYAEDGTIKCGIKLTHNKSKRYKKLQCKLGYIMHRQAVIRKLQHTVLANHLIALGNTFYVEDMNWVGLARRAKETAVSEKSGKYKRKKRFGKSIANKAPAKLIEILHLKCKILGLPGVVKVPITIKASQYNHITDSYVKKGLSERWNNMPDGSGKIQRDLYSAFLLQHTQEEQWSFDRDGLIKDYPEFTIMHNDCIKKLRNAPKLISSMGVKRAIS